MSDIVSVLNKESSKLSVNNDVSFKIDVNNSINTLPYGDINKILNVSEQFYKERNASTNYRFIFSINANRRTGIIDTTGKYVVEPKVNFEFYSHFTNGAALVEISNEILFIDRKGNEIGNNHISMEFSHQQRKYRRL
jgi:hypothetical protein